MLARIDNYAYTVHKVMFIAKYTMNCSVSKCSDTKVISFK